MRYCHKKAEKKLKKEGWGKMKKVFTFVLTITLLLCSGWSSHFYFASDEKTIEIEPQLYMGYGYSGVLTKDGNLYMWGYNWCGQIGNGDKEQQLTPVKVLDNVVLASLGYLHSGAVTEDGSLYMWGNNELGGVGNGTTEHQFLPIKVLDNVVNVVLGAYHSAAITKDGSLYMWGENDSGQVGNGTTEDQHLPEKVLDNIVSAAVTFDVAESAMTGAIAEDGSLYMWGYNEDGSLGNGIATGIQTIPLKIMECKKNVSDLIQQIEEVEGKCYQEKCVKRLEF